MTLVAVWVRQNSTLRELVAVADSRISGGESWDKCPKLLPLPRIGNSVCAMRCTCHVKMSLRRILLSSLIVWTNRW